MTAKDFGYHFHIISGRCSPTRNTTDKHRKIHELGFDIEYLKEIWDQQKGICPITGWPLILKTYKTRSEPLKPEHASIDRIDPKEGYVKGNIRFISIMANYALSNKFTDLDVYDFAASIMRHKCYSS